MLRALIADFGVRRRNAGPAFLKFDYLKFGLLTFGLLTFGLLTFGLPLTVSTDRCAANSAKSRGRFCLS
jgi:hypothetical protein